MPVELARIVAVVLLPPLGEGRDGGWPRFDGASGAAPTPTLPQRGREPTREDAHAAA